MNPELPQVRPSGEAVPQIPGSAEYFPDGQIGSGELESTGLEQQRPAQAEQLSQVVQAATQPTPVSSPYPATPPMAVQSSVAPKGDDGTPSLAADDDLIEKEWVDKVKKIIALTRGKPYEQAQAVAALQADYLKKRYNRTLGENDGQDF